MATNKEWAMRMIPVLIRWAQSSWDKTHYYSHLSKAVGHKTNQIGSVMGLIQDILDELKEKYGRNNIPTLNGLVQNKGTGLPSACNRRFDFRSQQTNCQRFGNQLYR